MHYNSRLRRLVWCGQLQSITSPSYLFLSDPYHPHQFKIHSVSTLKMHKINSVFPPNQGAKVQNIKGLPFTNSERVIVVEWMMSRQYMEFSASRRLKPWVTLNYFAAAQPTKHRRKQRSMMRDCKFSLSLHTQSQAMWWEVGR